jgi:hypothetical protein
LAGAGVAWASALELGHRRPIARAAARVRRSFFKAIDLGFAVMAVSFRVENRFPLYPENTLGGPKARSARAFAV